MRTPALALASFSLVLALGCGVMDEIDSAHAMLGIGEEKKPEKKAGETEAPEKKGIDWTVSRSINTGQVDPSITRCTLGGSTQFMREVDCLSRGGRPGQI